MYITAAQRFDKVQTRITIAFVVMTVITALCVIIAAMTCIRTQEFINQFECVEEAEIEIVQDSNGVNTAVIGEKSEVNVTYGTENNSQEEEVLAEKGCK